MTRPFNKKSKTIYIFRHRHCKHSEGKAEKQLKVQEKICSYTLNNDVIWRYGFKDINRHKT